MQVKRFYLYTRVYRKVDGLFISLFNGVIKIVDALRSYRHLQIGFDFDCLYIHII